MKTIISTLMILVLMTGIFAACTSSSAGSTTVSEEDAGKTVELETGDILVVSLDGNITTGFNWVPAPQDPTLLEQLGEAEATPDTDKIGSPGKIVLQFRAVATGQTNLHLDYKRPWEENTAPEKTFDITVIVK